MRSGANSVKKWGISTNVDTAATDIWSRANATADQKIWLAPTHPRVHQLKSTSANDTDGGTGLRTCRIYYLPAWHKAEEYVDATMNGTSDVALPKAAIIHRITPLTWGSSGPNVGTITCTADVDNTVTAQIEPSKGQTQMAIYGIPRGQSWMLESYFATAIKGSTGVSSSIELLVNPMPDITPTVFVSKWTDSCASDGAPADHDFQGDGPIYNGPAIIKLQANGSTTNLTVSGNFKLRLIN